MRGQKNCIRRMNSRLQKREVRPRGLALTPGPSPNAVGEGRLESAQADFALLQMQFQLPPLSFPMHSNIDQGDARMPLLLALLLIALAALPTSAQMNTRTYPQLISTRYATGQPLPADYKAPVANYDFVQKDRLPAGASVLSAARAKSGIVWVVTDRGVFRSQGDRYVPLETPRAFKPLQPEINEDTFVTCVTSDADGHLWAATTAGLYVTDGDQWWQALDRRDGMPYEQMTCLHLAPNGDVWGGTHEGAWRLRDGQFRYF